MYVCMCLIVCVCVFVCVSSNLASCTVQQEILRLQCNMDSKLNKAFSLQMLNL